MQGNVDPDDHDPFAVRLGGRVDLGDEGLEAFRGEEVLVTPGHEPGR